MSLLLDPRICPDCRAALDPEQTCTACGLRLVGQPAVQLWEHLVQADRLIEGLRLAPAPARAATAATAPAVSTTGLTTGLPSAPPLPSGLPPRARAAGTPRGVSSLSVQVVLLGVGGLCLLVAAAVFVAVNWSSLGLAGRTVVLTGVTALVAFAAITVTRRGLRGAAETLWLLTSALVTIDVVAAWAAGMLGDHDDRHLGGLLGAVLVIVAVATAAWVTTTPTARLLGMVPVAATGALLLTASEAWAAPESATGTAIAVPLLVLAALAIGRLVERKLALIAYAVGAVGLLSWFVLVVQGLNRLDTPAATWWQDVRGWPLLVAAILAAVPASLRRIPEEVRYLPAAASLVTLVAFVLGGTTGQDTEVVLVSGVVLALAALTALAPTVWARPAAALAGASGVVGLVLALVRPLSVIDLLPTTGPARSANLGERLPLGDWTLASWTAPLIAAVAAVALLSLLRHLPVPARPGARDAWIVTAPPLVGLGLVTALLEHRPDLVAAVLAWSVLAVLAAALTWARRATAAALVGGLLVSAYLVAAGLRLAVPSHLLVALVATVAAAVLAAAASRASTTRLEGALVPVLVAPAVFLAGFATTHWPYVVHATGDTAGLALVLVMAATGLAAVRLGRTPASRITIEVVALVGALVAIAFPIDYTLVVVIVTIAGWAVALVSILNRDRDRCSWIAVALLAVATLQRLADNATAPELYAVPAACVLVAAGVWRLLHDDEVSSWRALGSGLALGLVPSLLLTLEDPVSLRGAVLAAAGLVLLALGIQRRWGAPFLAGSAVVAILAVRHLGPVAAALPRWISLGSVGVVLLVVGITWEARRRDAAVAERYLAALR